MDDCTQHAECAILLLVMLTTFKAKDKTLKAKDQTFKAKDNYENLYSPYNGSIDKKKKLN